LGDEQPNCENASAATPAADDCIKDLRENGLTIPLPNPKSFTSVSLSLFFIFNF